MRGALLVVGLTACGFQHGNEMGGGNGSDGGTGSDGGSGSGSDGGGMGSDAQGCAWSYMPTNFDPCALPAPAPLAITGTQMIDVTTVNLPKKVLTQSDGSTITVIHLSQLSVQGGRTLTINGSGVVFAVDGPVDIDGALVAVGGNDLNTHCMTSRGAPGADSTSGSSGGGGGGGAGAADVGGNGGSGNGSQAGSGGARGTSATSTLSPLRGGCRGGNGGRHNSSGQAAPGGRGGGAVQISTNASIVVRGAIDAAGRGGGGGPLGQTGGAGGGSGGGIFLEGPQIDANFAAQICADGGSGGEGGGANSGNTGEISPCTTFDPARTSVTPASTGGAGGAGGYVFARSGNPGASSGGSGGGGGGGGGAVGWIRIKSPDYNNHGAAVTPAPTN